MADWLVALGERPDLQFGDRVDVEMRFLQLFLKVLRILRCQEAFVSELDQPLI